LGVGGVREEEVRKQRRMELEVRQQMRKELPGCGGIYCGSELYCHIFRIRSNCRKLCVLCDQWDISYPDIGLQSANVGGAPCVYVILFYLNPGY
jgi:hypothetical protein